MTLKKLGISERTAAIFTFHLSPFTFHFLLLTKRPVKESY
jgi:hypothetical protein